MAKKVLIVDKELNAGMIGVYETLRSHGFETDAIRRLEFLAERSRQLSDYDIAITHPTFEDLRTFNEEMQQRPDFRIILYGGNPMNGYRETEEGNVIRDSDQCIYIHWPQADELVRLVERGW